MDWFPAIWFGGMLFAISVLLAGHLTSGYSHRYQSISELAERSSPYAWLVRWIGFVPLGLSFVLFSRQTRDLFSNQIPSISFRLMGIAILLAGIFPTDPQNRRDTLSGKIHAIAVIALMILLSLAPFLFSISSLYRNHPAQRFFDFSFSMGMLALVFLAFMPNSDRPIRAAVHQRILLALHCVWWFVFSVVLAMSRRTL
jgi:hypothetical membrane protein